MYKKHLRLCCCFILIVSLLSACAPTAVPDDKIIIVSPAPTEEPRTFRQAEPVTRLKSLSALSIRNYVSLGDGLVFGADYDYAETGNVIHARIIDLIEGEIIHAVDIEGASSFIGCGGGYYYFKSDIEGQCFRCGSALDNLEQLPLPSPFGQFSKDGQHFYYIEDRILYDYSLLEKNSSPLPLTMDMRFSVITQSESTGEYLSLYAYKSEFTYETFLCLININGGEPFFMQEGLDSAVATDNGSFSALKYNFETFSYDIILDCLSDSPKCFSSTVLGAGGLGCQFLSGSPYMLHFLDTDPELEGSWVGGTELIRLGTELERCDLSQYGVDASLWNAVYLPAERLIVADMFENGSSYPIIIDCDKLSFTALTTAEPCDFTALDLGLAQGRIDEQAALPKGQDRARAFADILEEKYDVEILLSEQCTAPCATSDKIVTTTDKAGFKDETEKIMVALGQIELALKKYPEGYTAGFRNSVGEGGLRYLLVGPIDSDNGTVGFCFSQGLWNNIAIDISLVDIEPTVHHEMWHAVENYLAGVEGGSFYSGVWDGLNPEWFGYYETYDYTDVDYEKQMELTYRTASPEDTYFIDAYAKTFASEDRARIMEYMMSFNYEAKELSECPHIMEKLRVMARILRLGFDTSGWETPRWEQYLK